MTCVRSLISSDCDFYTHEWQNVSFFVFFSTTTVRFSKLDIMPLVVYERNYVVDQFSHVSIYRP